MRRLINTVYPILILALFGAVVCDYACDQSAQNAKTLAIKAAFSAKIPDNAELRAVEKLGIPSELSELARTLNKNAGEKNFSLIFGGDKSRANAYNSGILKREIAESAVGEAEFTKLRNKSLSIIPPEDRAEIESELLKKFGSVISEKTASGLAQSMYYNLKSAKKFGREKPLSKCLDALIELDIDAQMPKLLSLAPKTERIMLSISGGIGKKRVMKSYSDMPKNAATKAAYARFKTLFAYLNIASYYLHAPEKYGENRLKYAGLIHGIDRKLEQYNRPMMYYWAAKAGNDALAEAYKAESLKRQTLSDVGFKYADYVEYAARIFAKCGDDDSAVFLINTLISEREKYDTLRRILPDAKSPWRLFEKFESRKKQIRLSRWNFSESAMTPPFPFAKPNQPAPNLSA